MKYNLDGVSRLEGIMGCFNALGTIAFAYGGHNVVLEIQVGFFLPQRSITDWLPSSSVAAIYYVYM